MALQSMQRSAWCHKNMLFASGLSYMNNFIYNYGNTVIQCERLKYKAGNIVSNKNSIKKSHNFITNPYLTNKKTYGKDESAELTNEKDKKKTPKVKLKEVQIRAKIQEHDFQRKLESIIKFLNTGFTVLVRLYKGIHQDERKNVIMDKVKDYKETINVVDKIQFLNIHVTPVLNTKKNEDTTKNSSDELKDDTHK